MNCLKCLLPISGQPNHYGLHEPCFFTWFKTSEKSEFVSLARRSASSQSDMHHNPIIDSHFHGKFKKYSANLDKNSYILKMREKECPELPEVEYLCNQIGEMLGIPVAEYFMVLFNSEIVFVTKNFVDTKKPIDLQHIYHYVAGEYNCEELFRIIAENTQSPYDVDVLIKTILFDSLIGNNDRHGRNLALLVDAANKRLSPIYDNVTSLGLETGEMLKADFNPYGKIYTNQTKEPSMKDYVKELKALGYSEETQQFYSLCDLKNINEKIDNSFCSELMKKAIKRLINKRFEELKNEL